MPSLRSLFGRSSHTRQAQGPDPALVSAPPPAREVNRLVSPLPQGEVELPMEITAWSVRRLQTIFTQLDQTPNQQTVQDAQAARSCFTRFWLSAPVDYLEMLYAGPIGQAYKLMLRGVLPALPLREKDERWKAGLTQRLLTAFGHHETTNLLLAVMPYYDLNAMKVADPLRQIPEWLLGDYAERCDPQLLQKLRRRQPGGNGAGNTGAPALLAPAGSSGERPLIPSTEAEADGGPLPLFSEKRGEACLPLIQDNEFLGRMSGLINLYAIDPSDAELKRELAVLRRQVAQIWLDVDPDQLQTLYRAPFGQLTQNLIGSGFSRETMPPEEDAARRRLGTIVGAMRHPRSLNALMAALLYYPAGKVNLSAADSLLPDWLLQELTTLRARAAQPT